jgi:TRAP-type C4-dicarboxylate transport system permease small subunit
MAGSSTRNAAGDPVFARSSRQQAGAAAGSRDGGHDMNRAIDGFCRAVEILIAAFLAVMVAMVFGNVVLRYVFNSGIIVSEEVSRWLFLWVTFLGAVVALKEHGHLGTDALISRLPVLGKKICLVLGHLLMLYATWLVFSGALTQTRINLSVEAPVTGASMAFVYATGVVFAALAAPLLLRNLWHVLTGRLSEADMVMIQGTEEKGGVEALQAKPAGEKTASRDSHNNT